MSHDLHHRGFALVPGVLDAAGHSRLLAAIGPATGPGRRGLLSNPAVVALASSPTLIDLVRLHLDYARFPLPEGLDWHDQA